MSRASALPVLLVVLASYLIVLWAARRRRSQGVEDYLFSGNNPFLAISSGLGSVFSVSVACTALLSGGFVFGWQIVFPLSAGGICGLVALLAALKNRQVEAFADQLETQGRPGGVTYLAMSVSVLGPLPYFLLAGLSMLVYWTLLVTELAVVRVTLGSITQLAAPELLLVLMLVVGVCFAYTYIGGYRGLLLTDHFQLLVIVGFFGALIAGLGSDIWRGPVPSPTLSRIDLSGWLRPLALYAAVFCGSFCLTLGSLDQWIRTVGTLPARRVKTVLTTAVLLSCSGASAVLLIGSIAGNTYAPSPDVTNELSLILFRDLLESSSETLRFFFLAALGAIILTTLDTYLITIQQLYYEFSIRLDAKTHRQYVFEYLAKWRDIRVVGGALLAVAFVLSLVISPGSIYVFGVGALSGYVFLAPTVIIWLGKPCRRSARRVAVSQLGALGLFPLCLAPLHFKLGPIQSHLHLITLAATLAVLAATALVKLASYFVDEL